MLTAADTAYSIAFVRAQESERAPSERLFEDPYASIFAAAGEHAREGTERFLALPFFSEAVRLRTRFIDDVVTSALDAGTTQVVLLGAGFDARALRLPAIAKHGASVYEVDFAEQLARKRALLDAARVTLPAWDHYVACDFNAPDFDDALMASLAERGFRAGAGAVFVWEGVIAYISKEATERTMRFVVRVGGPGARLVFDFAPIALEPDTAENRARRAGFTRFEQVGNDAIWRRHFASEPPPIASVGCLGTAFV
jgi:methyltransferase (TIGR00027 family)